MHGIDEFVVLLANFNGHVDRHVDRFDGVHGWYGLVQRNFERLEKK